MSPTLKNLGIDRLTIEQRVALAQEILDSVVAERPPIPLTEGKRQELQRRLAEHTADPGSVIPWEQIEAEALARFGK
jgi:putative addiction module component (TIGR02574 family)